MAKKVKRENIDMISDLPDSILSYILSFLPTKEAVATSVLSTKWRYMFTLASNLDIELNQSVRPKSFNNIVDMFFDTKKVENFRLKTEKRVDCIWFHRWISSAVSHGVNHLDLSISLSKFTLPIVLLTCNTLVTLKLDVYFVSNFANDVCLPNLKTLHLKPKRYSNNDSVKSLVSSCTNLEDLVLENCTMKNIDISHDLVKRLTILSSIHCNSVVIVTPAVAYFKYTDYVARGYSFKKLKSLVKVDVDLLDDNHQAEATSIFEGINKARSLSLSFSSLRLFNRCEPLPIFPNLVRLKIRHDSYCYYSERGLANILANSDELEELAFNQEVLGPLPKKVPICVLFRLKVIEISRFHSRKACIGKAKYFLENARVLKKLTIRIAPLVSEEKKLKISEELLAFPRQAKECCILIV